MGKLAIPVAVAFCSSMAALVYEIVWMRVFTPIFGRRSVSRSLPGG